MKQSVKFFLSSAQRRDLALLVALLVVAVWLSHTYDLFERFAEWAEAHEDWEVDELAVIAMFLVVGLGFFSLRRWREALRETEVHRSTAERLQAREGELVTSEERFRQTFEAATTAVALVAIEDGRFRRVNQAGCDILGYDIDELAAMTAWDVIHPDDLAEHGERFRQVARGELPSAETQLRYVRRGGSVAHGLVAVAMVGTSPATRSTW